MKSNNLKIYQKTSRTIFKHIKHTFPFNGKEDFLGFEKKFKNYFSGLEKIKSDHEFFIYLEKFLALLKNSHTKIMDYPGKKYYKPKGYSVITCESNFFLKKSDKIIGEIISIDNQQPKNILKQRMKRISGSTKQYLEQQALKFVLIDNQGGSVNLKLKIKNQQQRLTLKRNPIEFIPWKNIIETKIIKNKIGYLYIRSWKDKENSIKILEQKFKYLLNKKVKSLIIDVRGNGGGNSNIAKYLAAHFFEKKVLFSITKSRVNKTNFKLKSFRSYVEPQKLYFSLPIILLIDTLCLSSNEYFIAGMKDNQRAYLIGETTGGGSGNPKFFNIPFKESAIKLSVSTWQYFRPNKKSLEGKGVQPHLTIKKKYQDLLQNKDVILETAIKKARQGDLVAVQTTKKVRANDLVYKIVKK